MEVTTGVGSAGQQLDQVSNGDKTDDSPTRCDDRHRLDAVIDDDLRHLGDISVGKDGVHAPRRQVLDFASVSVERSARPLHGNGRLVDDSDGPAPVHDHEMRLLVAEQSACRLPHRGTSVDGLHGRGHDLTGLDPGRPPRGRTYERG
jgi:hypothetical protein